MQERGSEDQGWTSRQGGQGVGLLGEFCGRRPHLGEPEKHHGRDTNLGALELEGWRREPWDKGRESPGPDWGCTLRKATWKCLEAWKRAGTCHTLGFKRLALSGGFCGPLNMYRYKSCLEAGF